MEWKEAVNTVCRLCSKETVKYRIVEDSEGHEDDHCRCDSCGYEWWLDGSDY